jgi:hypothetical protein
MCLVFGHDVCTSSSPMSRDSRGIAPWGWIREDKPSGSVCEWRVLPKLTMKQGFVPSAGLQIAYMACGAFTTCARQRVYASVCVYAASC